MKTMLHFKLAKTQEAISPLSGLILYMEQMLAMSLPKLIIRWLPKAGSNRGYAPTAYVIPILLMLLGGGRTIEDIRKIANDKAYYYSHKLRFHPVQMSLVIGCEITEN